MRQSRAYFFLALCLLAKEAPVWADHDADDLDPPEPSRASESVSPSPVPGNRNPIIGPTLQSIPSEESATDLGLSGLGQASREAALRKLDQLSGCFGKSLPRDRQAKFAQIDSSPKAQDRREVFQALTDAELREYDAILACRMEEARKAEPSAEQVGKELGLRRLRQEAFESSLDRHADPSEKSAYGDPSTWLSSSWEDLPKKLKSLKPEEVLAYLERSKAKAIQVLSLEKENARAAETLPLLGDERLVRFDSLLHDVRTQWAKSLVVGTESQRDQVYRGIATDQMKNLNLALAQAGLQAASDGKQAGKDPGEAEAPYREAQRRLVLSAIERGDDGRYGHLRDWLTLDFIDLKRLLGEKYPDSKGAISDYLKKKRDEAVAILGRPSTNLNLYSDLDQAIANVKEAEKRVANEVAEQREKQLEDVARGGRRGRGAPQDKEQIQTVVDEWLAMDRSQRNQALLDRQFSKEDLSAIALGLEEKDAGSEAKLRALCEHVRAHGRSEHSAEVTQVEAQLKRLKEDLAGARAQIPNPSAPWNVPLLHSESYFRDIQNRVKSLESQIADATKRVYAIEHRPTAAEQAEAVKLLGDKRWIRAALWRAKDRAIDPDLFDAVRGRQLDAELDRERREILTDESPSDKAPPAAEELAFYERLPDSPSALKERWRAWDARQKMKDEDQLSREKLEAMTNPETLRRWLDGEHPDSDRRMNKAFREQLAGESHDVQEAFAREETKARATLFEGLEKKLSELTEAQIEESFEVRLTPDGKGGIGFGVGLKEKSELPRILAGEEKVRLEKMEKDAGDALFETYGKTFGVDRAFLDRNFVQRTKMDTDGKTTLSLEFREDSPLKALEARQFLVAGTHLRDGGMEGTSYDRSNDHSPANSAQVLGWHMAFGDADPSTKEGLEKLDHTESHAGGLVDSNLDFTYVIPTGAAFKGLGTLWEIGAREGLAAAAKYSAIQAGRLAATGGIINTGFYAAGVIAARGDGIKAEFTRDGIVSAFLQGAALAPVMKYTGGVVPMSAGGLKSAAESFSQGNVYSGVLDVASFTMPIWLHALTRGGAEGNEVPDFFKTLGLEEDAGFDEIKKRFLERALETHPERGGDPKTFGEIVDAYRNLEKLNANGRLEAYRSALKGKYQPGMAVTDRLWLRSAAEETWSATKRVLGSVVSQANETWQHLVSRGKIFLGLDTQSKATPVDMEAAKKIFEKNGLTEDRAEEVAKAVRDQFQKAHERPLHAEGSFQDRYKALRYKTDTARKALLDAGVDEATAKDIVRRLIQDNVLGDREGGEASLGRQSLVDAALNLAEDMRKENPNAVFLGVGRSPAAPLAALEALDEGSVAHLPGSAVNKIAKALTPGRREAAQKIVDWVIEKQIAPELAKGRDKVVLVDTTDSGGTLGFLAPFIQERLAGKFGDKAPAVKVVMMVGNFSAESRQTIARTVSLLAEHEIPTQRLDLNQPRYQRFGDDSFFVYSDGRTDSRLGKIAPFQDKVIYDPSSLFFSDTPEGTKVFVFNDGTASNKISESPAAQEARRQQLEPLVEKYVRDHTDSHTRVEAFFYKGRYHIYTTRFVYPADFVEVPDGPHQTADGKRGRYSGYERPTEDGETAKYIEEVPLPDQPSQGYLRFLDALKKKIAASAGR